MDDRLFKSKYRVPSQGYPVTRRKKLGRKDRLSGTLVNLDVASTYDPTADSDASYRDAIFDSSLRQFIRMEYGSVEPPPGVLGRVQRAIEQDMLEPASHTPRRVWMLQDALMMLRNVLNRQLMGKLLPSCIVLVLALGISLSAIRSEQARYGPHSSDQAIGPVRPAQISGELPTTAPVAETGQSLLTSQGAITALPGLPESQTSDYEDSSSGASDVDQYDLHTPPKKPSDNYRTRNEAATLGR